MPGSSRRASNLSWLFIGVPAKSWHLKDTRYQAHSCMSACLGTGCMHAVPPPNLARVRALGLFLSRRLWIGGHPELIESSPGIHHDDGGLLGCKVWPHKSLCQVLNKIGVGRLNPCTMAGVCATELDHSISVQWSMMNVLRCEVMSWKWSHLL
jgi:hypothetical protein